MAAGELHAVPSWLMRCEQAHSGCIPYACAHNRIVHSEIVWSLPTLAVLAIFWPALRARFSAGVERRKRETTISTEHSNTRRPSIKTGLGYPLNPDLSLRLCPGGLKQRLHAGKSIGTFGVAPACRSGLERTQMTLLVSIRQIENPRGGPV